MYSLPLACADCCMLVKNKYHFDKHFFWEVDGETALLLHKYFSNPITCSKAISKHRIGDNSQQSLFLFNHVFPTPNASSIGFMSGE